MTTWKLSDRTVVSSGGKVKGRSELARALLVDLEEPESVRVHVVAPPGGDVPLDPSNDYLLDAWIRARAARQGVTVETTYEPSIDDAPEDVRRLIEERDNLPKLPEGTVY